MNTDRKGFFITFEGIDGVGKTTQAKRLKFRLQQEIQKPELKDSFSKIIYTREPYQKDIAIQIGAYTQNLFAYNLDRNIHVTSLLLPSLESPTIVICDRYNDSSLAYQGYGCELLKEAKIMGEISTSGLTPDLTFFLDPIDRSHRDLLHIQEGVLLRDRPNYQRYCFSPTYLLKVNQGYKQIAKDNRYRIISINANQSQFSIEEIIFAETMKRIQLKIQEGESNERN